MSNEPLDKLPRWARERIRVLEMQLAEATSRLDALFGTVATDTTWCDLVGHHPLPKGTLIRFRMGDGDDTRIDVWLRNGRLEVAGGGPIEIQLESANWLSIGRIGG